SRGMTRFDDAFAPLAVATRSGYDESLFHGAAVALRPDGSVIASAGDPHVPVYPRSALKPMQATAMAELGLVLPGHLMAIVCASHDGCDVHIDAVREVLALFDLAESDLRNTPSHPYDAAARDDAIRQGAAPSAIRQNCSGKHAGMLATCRVNGWPLADYLESDHPVQMGITESIERHGAPVVHVGIDGCGAPTHAIALDDLARAFAGIATAQADVAGSMTARPDLVGGATRDVTRWMQAVPGLVAKDGADGVMAGALPDGRSFAIKVAGGSDGARQAATGEALRVLGVDVDGSLAATLDATRPIVSGHGHEVGRIDALPWTRPSGTG
ncbi:MAG: asparaginase, partial [Ilumatobacteraceae bacterium]